MEIYISGPMSSLPYAVYRRNFMKAEKELKELYPSAEIFNPIEVTNRLGVNAKYYEYMREDLPRLFKCTHIYMLQGWSGSKGARLEWEIAKAINLEFLYQ